MEKFLPSLLLLLLLSYGSCEAFFKIFEDEDDGGEIRGITDDEPMLAIVTKNFVIFGNVDSSFLFTETSKIGLTKNLTGNNDLLEFKFLTFETVIICNGRECSICINNEHKCTTIVSFPIMSVNAEMVDAMLFLRVVHEKNNATIYSFKFKNDVYERIGTSIDRTSDIHEFMTFYSFSHGPHTYFISQIKREDIVLCLTAQNSSRINTDVVITQLCNNDQRDEIKSRIDLRLSCKLDAADMGYSDNLEIGHETYQHNIKGVTFVQNLKQIFLSLQVSSSISYICQFNISEIDTEFCNTWNFCQRNVSVIPDKCKIGQYEKVCLKFATTNDSYSMCKNDDAHSKNLNNKCDSAAYLETQKSGQIILDKMEKWTESHATVNGIIMPEESYSNTYGPLFNSDKQLYITSNDLLGKTGNDISNYLGGLSDIRNVKMLTLWDLKNGIMYVDPLKRNTIYLKEVVCSDECYDELYSTNLICHLCDQKYSAICNYEETQVYCGPVWRKFVMLKGKRFDQKNIVIKYKGTERRMECYTLKDKKPQQCSKSLDEYLTPFFTAPLTANKLVEYQLIISNSTLVISLIVAGTFVALLAFMFLVYCIYKKQLRKKQKGRKPYMEALIKSERLIILQKIGEGNSAIVNLGEYINAEETKRVAVKTLQCCKADVIKEIEALSSCSHNNIVSFIGWMEIDDEMRIVTEYMPGGDLHSYLKNPDKLLMISTIFSYIFQALDAMIYLSHKHKIHRDLAARNCLLNETFECLKISDFGLARATNIDYEYKPEVNRPLPFRWLPLEAFKSGEFTVKGDIWSFGVLIWELFERGAHPYKNLNFDEVVAFLESGKRLMRPEQCPLELYTVMLWCWDEKPIDRPNFDAIKDDIKAVHSHIKLYEAEKLNITVEATGYEIPNASK